MAEETSFDALMRQVCVGWGHCGSVQAGRYVHVTDLIPETCKVTAAQFAEWVLLAEGYDGISSPHQKLWLKRIADSFVEHMGSTSVAAQQLRVKPK